MYKIKRVPLPRTGDWAAVFLLISRRFWADDARTDNATVLCRRTSFFALVPTSRLFWRYPVFRCTNCITHPKGQNYPYYKTAPSPRREPRVSSRVRARDAISTRCCLFWVGISLKFTLELFHHAIASEILLIY